MRKRKTIDRDGVIRKRGGSSYNFCCTSCRFTTKGRYSVDCPHCHKKMLSMGYRFRMPRKLDDNAWKKLEKENLIKEKEDLKYSIKRAKKAILAKEEFHF